MSHSAFYQSKCYAVYVRKRYVNYYMMATWIEWSVLMDIL